MHEAAALRRALATATETLKWCAGNAALTLHERAIVTDALAVVRKDFPDA